jgi:hypothetical protein
MVDAEPDVTNFSWSPWLLLQLLCGLFILLITMPFTLMKNIIGDTANGGHNTRLAFLLTIIAILSFKVMAEPDLTVATISEAVYLCKQDGSNATHADFEWCSDTGTNRFVTNDRADFLPTSIVTIDTKVAVGNGSYTCTQQGTVLVQSAAGQTIACSNVLYMPNCGKKLMPATPFVRKGCNLTLYDNDKIKLCTAEGKAILTGKEIEGLYYFECKTIHPSTISPVEGGAFEFDKSIPPSSADNYFGLQVGAKISEAANDFAQRLLETHFAYGHLNFTKLRKLLGLKAGDNPHCAACAVAQSRQAPLNKEPDRSTRVNHRMHADIGYTAGSQNPFQLYIDDYTRVGHLDLLATKDEVLQYWIELRDLLENRHSPWKFAFFRSDNEFVYTSNAWIEHCREAGIEHEFSPPYRHDGLGVVERAMQVIGVAFRCMMLQGNAPQSMIPYSLMHSNIIRNHSPTKANKGLTPLEKQAGMKLPFNQRLAKGVLFCLFYVHIYDEQRIKHGDRSVPCVYLGFDDRNNQFIGMEWLTGKIHYVGDGTFHNMVFPFRANPHKVPDWMNAHDRLTPSTAVSVPNPANHSLPTGPRRSYRQHSYQFSGGGAIADIPDVGIPPDDISQNHHLHDIDSGTPLNFSPELYFVHSWGKDPANWVEAMAGPYANEWIVAMLAERESFRQHEVYILVPRSEAAGSKIFKSRPVLKIKLNPPTADEPNGSLDKFKYRLTIAAFTRMLIEGIDYKEKHASTVRWNALKVLIAEAVQHDWDLLHIDIKTFFLYGVLDEGTKVFMEQPAGWDTADKPAKDYVCLLDKSVYGHPAASHCAQKVLKNTLTSEGKFSPTTADDCVYVSNPDLPGYSAAGTHVDDILAAGDSKGLSLLSTTLKSKFELTEKLNPTVITGVQIERCRETKWLKLHQGDYVSNMLVDHDMQDCIPVDTPMDPGTARALMLLPTEVVDQLVLKKYQSLVGSLLWLYKTRPDLMYVTNLLARFCRSATAAHLKLAMRVLRYLKGTIDYGIVFQAGFKNDGVLSAEADADLAGDLLTSRSTSGGYVKLGEHGTVACNSSLERKISTSTGQAETYSLASLVKEVVWIRHLLYELRLPQTKPTRTGTDNQGVEVQATKSVNHATAKHYRISQAYVRSKDLDGTIKVVKVSTALNHSDFLTKPLCRLLFERHRDAVMGPQCPPALVK